jgi:TolB-like protein
MSFISELKRRNVFRVGTAYGVVAWLLVEVASVVLPTFGAPDWVMKVFTFLVILGFPLALILAWAFELTPDGIKRETEVNPTEPVTRKARGKLDFAIVALLVLALVYLAADKFLLSAETEPAEGIAERIPAAESVGVEKSIAVLPFVNMSADPDNEYFSDGISEELLNTLARIPDLKVAARTSAFQFKGQNRDIAEIGRLLKVSNVLEGSVRKAGSRVRVTAQLIQVDDGFHLWSETFDRELTDIFAIQDEIAASIADALKTTLSLSADRSANLTGTNSIEAYEFYLRGMQNWHLREPSTLRDAEELFRRAAEIDPGFAKAYAGLALTYAIIASYVSEPEASYVSKTNAAARRALAIDPQNAEALASMANVEPDLDKSAQIFERAIAINPSFATAYQWYGEANWIAGNLDECLRLMARAFDLDPRSRIIGINLALYNLNFGREDEALRVLEQVKTFAPDFSETLGLEFMTLLISGQPDAAAVVGKKLAESLRKQKSNVKTYLDLFGAGSQSDRAAEELLAWPRDSRMDPESPALVYDFDLFFLLAAAGQHESALKLMPRLAKTTTRFLAGYRWSVQLSSFNCIPDAQVIYASLPITGVHRENVCPASDATAR